jgi:hypothetical protein
VTKDFKGRHRGPFKTSNEGNGIQKLKTMNHAFTVTGELGMRISQKRLQNATVERHSYTELLLRIRYREVSP